MPDRPTSRSPGSAEACARYLLRLGEQESEPVLLTHLHLHKLLYYAQGWCLAVRGTPLFTGTLQAWRHGPVVKELYPRFADFKANAIPPSEGGDGSSLSADDRAILESIWAQYGQYSAPKLRSMTHAEPPWREARGSLPDSASSNATISDEALRRFFGQQHERRCRELGSTSRAVETALTEARSGQTVLLESLKLDQRPGVP